MQGFPSGYIEPGHRRNLHVQERNNMNYLVLFFMIVAFGGVLYLRAFLTRRGIFKVIEIFRRSNALGINGARTLHELGLERPNFLERITKPRDYKQYALQMLVKRGIILETGDGKFYLFEERLDQSLKKKT
jgi:hypothetical protein